MGKVIITPFVKQRLVYLAEVLYEDEYFGFYEDAITYADVIINFIYTIPSQKRKLCYNPARGTWYCRYQHNRKTFWFITFDTDGETFIIRDIINNYSPDCPQFISG